MKNKLHLRNHGFDGKLLVFEGTDGAGKTTMLKMCEQYLRSYTDRETVVFKQPTPVCRDSAMFQEMMYNADNKRINYRAVQLMTMSDRHQHFYELIEPSLKSGKTVLLDRYIYTSLANMLARGYNREKWFYSAAKYLVRPDATFLMYVDPDMALERILSRPEEKGRYLNERLLREVSVAFKQILKPNGMIPILADGTPETTFALIKWQIQKIFSID